jgi:hypothetical protein
MFGSIAAQSGSFTSLVAVALLVDWAKQLDEKTATPIKTAAIAPVCFVLVLVLVLVLDSRRRFEDEDD